MRRLILAFLIALAPAAALADGMLAPLNEVVRVSVSVPIKDVVVGNPAIADVTVADQHHLLIFGKQFGTTNLIVTGLNGRTLIDRQLTVPAHTPDFGQVTVVSGTTVKDYYCTTACASQAEAVSQTEEQKMFGSLLGSMAGAAKAASSGGGASSGTSAPGGPGFSPYTGLPGASASASVALGQPTN